MINNIIICDKCSGTGKIYRVNEFPLDPKEEICEKCNGSGRVLELNISLQIEYTSDESKKLKIIKFDKDVMELRKKLIEDLKQTI